MMTSQRAAVAHAARAQNDGLCKGKLNRASAESFGEYHHYAAVTGRVTSNPEVNCCEQALSLIDLNVYWGFFTNCVAADSVTSIGIALSQRELDARHLSHRNG